MQQDRGQHERCVIPGNNGRAFDQLYCNNCRVWGHVVAYCPYPRKVPDPRSIVDGVQQMHSASIVEPASVPDNTTNDVTQDTDDESHDVVMSFQCLNRHTRPEGYTDSSILIDSGSTCSVFHNKVLLQHITKSSTTLRAFTNGGHQDSKHVGWLPGFFPVWYNPQSMMNILAWCDVRRKFRITTDTDISDEINVHISANEIMVFKEVASGLYMLNNHNINSPVTNYSFLSLVNQNRSNFNRRDLLAIDRARNLYRSLGMPGYSTFLHLIQNNLIRNNPVTVTDVQRCLFVCGPDTASLQGRSVRRRPEPIPTVGYVPLPAIVLNLHPTSYILHRS